MEMIKITTQNPLGIRKPKAFSWRAWSMALLLSALSMSSFGQTLVKGTVISAADDMPLIGVNILIKGSSKGVVTDFDGNYSIEVPGPESVLVFSSLGFQPQEIVVGTQSEINITMQEDFQQLQEVVVVGYETQERSKVVGAISTVGAEEITQTPVFTADQALQGRAAGVTVVNNGAPGADPVIRVRNVMSTGSNSPLVVVDGIIVSGLGDINPNDIESVSVLKDAATTAIYGALGSNGVIMITTKSGSEGEIKVDFDAYAGTQFVTQRFDVMNTEEYLEYAQDWGLDLGRLYDADNLWIQDNVNTDWQDEILRSAPIQSYNLGVSGGNKNASFRVSGNYIGQEGVMLNTGSDRFTFRTNTNYTKGKLKMGQTLAISFTSRRPENFNGGRSALEHAIKAPPYMPVYNSDNVGGYQGPDNNLDSQDAENAVRVLEHPERDNRRTNILGSVFAEYEIIENLFVKGQFGLDRWSFTNETFIPSYSDGAAHAQPFAIIEKNTGTRNQFTAFGQIRYERTFFEKHNVSAMVLGERLSTYDTRINTYSINEISDELDNLTNVQSNITSTENEYTKVGYLFSLKYDYQGRYLFSGSYRTDASSRFGPNNRWAPFYAVSAGWLLSEEEFFPVNPYVSTVKIRGSYGTVGNDRIGDYRYSGSIVSGSYNYPFNPASGELLAPGTTAGNVANPDLKWETTTMTNVGVDLGLWGDRITFSAEYFRNESDDLLINVLLPPSLGGHNDRGPRNVGNVEVSGFELNLGINEQDGDFTWQANLNVSTSRNKVNSLGGEVLTDANFENGPILRSIQGEPLFHYYGYRVDRLFQSEADVITSPQQAGNPGPGDIKYKDLNGDNVIDEQDQEVIGSAIPDMTFGLNFTAQYKGFDFNLFLNGTQGNEIYNTNIWDLEGVQRFFNASPRSLDAWTPENTDTDIPRLNSDPINLVTSDRFVEDGSFVRVKNVTVGYTFPTEWLKGYAKSLRVYVSGQNLLTFTEYSGLDPEIGSSPVFEGDFNNNLIGIDRGNFPVPVTLIGGLQVKF